MRQVDLDPEMGCWVWIGYRSRQGYAKFQVVLGEMRTRVGHRWLYEHFYGSVPEGLELDHLCENRACVNPSHLDPVTHSVNISRRLDRKGVCKNGHDLTKDDSYSVYKDGHRRCNGCSKLNRDKTRAKAKAKSKLSSESIIGG